MSRSSATPSSVISEPFLVRVKLGTRAVSLRIAPDAEDGGYVVTSPSLRGLNTQGETVDEAISNGIEAALTLMTEPRRPRHG